MASIQARNSGWRVRWRNPPGFEPRHPSRQFETRKAAQRFRREVEEYETRGELWQPDAPRTRPLLRDVVSGYVLSVARTRKQETALTYAAKLEPFLDFVDQRHRRRRSEPRLDVLSRRLVEDYYDDLRARGVKTAHAYARCVLRMWQWAWDHDDYGDETPRPRKPEIGRGSPAAPARAPSWAEVDLVIAWLLTRTHLNAEAVYRTAVIQRFTGLRQRQARLLKWDDIDLESLTLTVRPELGKTRQESRGRIVPLAAELGELMAGWGRRDGLVIGTDIGRKNYCGHMRRAWEHTDADQRIWHRRPSHALRKCFATELTRSGTPERIVGALIGHAGGVLGRYIEQDLEAMRAAVASVPPIGGGTVCVLRAGDG